MFLPHFSNLFLFYLSKLLSFCILLLICFVCLHLRSLNLFLSSSLFPFFSSLSQCLIVFFVFLNSIFRYLLFFHQFSFSFLFVILRSAFSLIFLSFSLCISVFLGFNICYAKTLDVRSYRFFHGFCFSRSIFLYDHLKFKLTKNLLSAQFKLTSFLSCSTIPSILP